MVVLTMLNGEVEIVKELDDLKQPIIDSMGYDVWDFLKRGDTEELAQVKSVLEIREEEIEGYDTDITSLRGTLLEVQELTKKLKDYLSDSKRLNRDHLYRELSGMEKLIENTEGF